MDIHDLTLSSPPTRASERPGAVRLVPHDRYRIRSVADDLIEVRGGTATFHHGVEERVLTPAGPTSRRDGPAAATPSTSGSRRSKPAKQPGPDRKSTRLNSSH